MEKKYVVHEHFTDTPGICAFVTCQICQLIYHHYVNRKYNLVAIAFTQFCCI